MGRHCLGLQCYSIFSRNHCDKHGLALWKKWLAHQCEILKCLISFTYAGSNCSHVCVLFCLCLTSECHFDLLKFLPAT